MKDKAVIIVISFALIALIFGLYYSNNPQVLDEGVTLDNISIPRISFREIIDDIDEENLSGHFFCRTTEKDPLVSGRLTIASFNVEKFQSIKYFLGIKCRKGNLSVVCLRPSGEIEILRLMKNDEGASINNTGNIFLEAGENKLVAVFEQAGDIKLEMQFGETNPEDRLRTWNSFN